MLQQSAFMPLPGKIFASPVESRSAELAAGLQVERFAPLRETVSRKAAKSAKSTGTDQKAMFFRPYKEKPLAIFAPPVESRSAELAAGL